MLNKFKMKSERYRMILDTSLRRVEKIYWGFMKAQVSSDLPTIYADMNVFRYVSYGELMIEAPERFRWVYSYAHLNEMNRSGNTDALDGMRRLKAVEICDVLNENFEPVGNITLRDYLDPDERYQQHLNAIAGCKISDDPMIEHLLRIFGADNFEVLSRTTDIVRNDIIRLTRKLDAKRRGELLARADIVSADMQASINMRLKDRRPIDQTRLEMGLTSNVREDAAKSDSPIDALWEIVGPSLGSISKAQFFGFEPNPAMQGVPHTQHGALGGAHIVLNLLGLSPDKGLAKREKIRNVLSDGQHVGMASYCNGLLSADKRFCVKANAIYTHIGSPTKALWFPYKPEGTIVRLGIS